MKTRNSFAAWSGVFVVLALGTACGGEGGGGGSSTPAVAITVQPADQSVVAGTSATFEVVATHATGYQWQHSTDEGVTFDGVVGATSASYTTPVASLADDGTRYRVVVSNGAGSVTSAVATLTVSLPSPPSFTTQPVDVAIIAGGDAQFTVAVSGTPTPTLQWQLSADGGASWNDVSGATGTVFSVLNAALGNDGRRFRAVATNSAGAVYSNAATLTVTPAGLVSITTTSPLPAGTVDTAYGVALAASGGTPPYTWSVPDGSTLPAFLTLSASGEISGTLPDVEAVYGLNIRVADSADPPNTDERRFELSAVRPCDHGLGFLTVDNAPPSVGSKFCPATVTAQLVPNDLGLVYVVWTETHDYGGGAYFESVLVEFYPVSGAINFLTYHLSDPTHLVDYDCALTGDAYRRACSGVSLDPSTGELFFLNTNVGMTPAFTLTLNGLLFYTP